MPSAGRAGAPLILAIICTLLVPSPAAAKTFTQLTLSAPQTAAIREPVTVSGRFTLGGLGTPGQRVGITADGTEVATSQTGTDGAWTAELRFEDFRTFTIRASASLGPLFRTYSDELTIDAVAEPVPAAQPTDLATASGFLYQGSDPIQKDVAPGTITFERAAILRGKVLDAQGVALAGVRVDVLNHPELGWTLSRSDGMYDLAVNGGGALTVRLSKDGFVPSQRRLEVQWQEYASAPDVVLVRYDAAVTTVALGAAAQTARGSVSEDDAGTRRATLLFPAGTEATMTLPDGSTQPLSTLHVRATEYTVGDRGPQAMPGELPPASAYTYAVEYSVDEAVAADAGRVSFSKPLATYVENFLGLPVGVHVPAGWYDRERGEWVGAPDGRVVKIVRIADGRADLDIDGNGAADGSAALAALGIDDAERERLASLYADGTSLWRVPVDHFTPWDYNFPYGPPRDARYPDDRRPRTNEPTEDDDCKKAGSVVGCIDQTLGEAVPVDGTPFTLNYTSARAKGYGGGAKLRIPLSGPELPSSVRRIDLVVDIAGQHFESSFAPVPNQTHTFVWDGKDAYGREVYGLTSARIRTGYVYRLEYKKTKDDFSQSFGRVGGPGMQLVPPGGRPPVEREMILWHDSQATLSAPFRPQSLGIGGWTLDIHHSYDPKGRVLLGTGDRRTSQPTERVVTLAAGDGGSDYREENVPATETSIGAVYDHDVGADGSVYLSDSPGYARLRRIGPDGRIHTVAGDGTMEGCSDGAAANARFAGSVFAIAIGPDDSVYVADASNYCIRKVSPGGAITTVAGSGQSGSSGDGGPATQARLGTVFGLAVGTDGTLYIADTYNFRVRQVTPDGIISTLAGTGREPDYDPSVGYVNSGDGGPASAAKLGFPDEVAVGTDGSVYIGESYTRRVRRVDTAGVITTVAGGGRGREDGIDATQAALDGAQGLAVSDDGTLYMVDDDKVRAVSPGGIITTVAGGKDDSCVAGHDGIRATQICFSQLYGVALAPDGRSLYTGNTSQRRLYRIEPSLPGLSLSDKVIPSSDGSEVYVFDARGTHLRTLDALTGALRFEFTYDTGRRLVQVTDGYGNATLVERRADGTPVAIVAPGGRRTLLEVDATGYLSRIARATGPSAVMTYTTEGLLTQMTDAVGGVHRFAYDGDGRLVRDEGPDGRLLVLARSVEDDGRVQTVTATTGLGRRTVYRSEELPSGERTRTVTGPDNATTVERFAIDGRTTVTYPQGQTLTERSGSDPRFGPSMPVMNELTFTVPGGPTMSMTGAREVRLADPRDKSSLVSQTDTLSINGKAHVTTYDAPSKLVTRRTPAGRTATLRLDARGRAVELTPAAGITPMSVTYDARGLVTEVKQGTSVTSYAYDAEGRRVSRTEPGGRVVQYAYDADGRLSTRTSETGTAIGFGYDAADRRTSVAMPSGDTHGLSYTNDGALAGYEPPGAGYAWTYDADGGRSGSTLPSGRRRTGVFDAAGRLTGITYPEASIAVSYVGGLVSELTRTAGVEAQSLALRYAGDLLTEASASGPATGRFRYRYNGDLDLAGVTLDDRAEVVLGRDADGLLTQLGSFAYTRNGPAGDPTRIADATMAMSLTYDAMGRLASRTQAVAGRSVLGGQYRYDDGGRLTSVTETVGGVGRTTSYLYDAEGRLTRAAKPGAVADYAYDANGNRTSAAGDAATYDAQDRLVRSGAIDYTFDADGFLTGRGADRFEYSARGELLHATVGASAITYGYDALGRRVSRTDQAGTVQYLYGDLDQPFRVSATRDASGALTTYVYDEGGRLYALDRAGTRYYVGSDLQGSPRVISDASGNVVKTVEYDAFGRAADTQPGFVLAIGFAGGLADPATGLVRFGVRDYEPASGRWTSRDPVLFQGGQANLYAYVGNDPVNFIDPTGLVSVGVSAYEGIGGGIKVSITADGFSICGEIGFGAGMSVEVDPLGGLERDRSMLFAEASGSVGPVSGKVGGEYSSGCEGGLSPKARFCVGPFCTTGKGASVKTKPDAESRGKAVGKSISDAIKNASPKLEGKAGFRQCGGLKW